MGDLDQKILRIAKKQFPYFSLCSPFSFSNSIFCIPLPNLKAAATQKTHARRPKLVRTT